MTDTAVQNAIALRDEMAEKIAEAEKRIVEWREQMYRAERFIADWEEFSRNEVKSAEPIRRGGITGRSNLPVSKPKNPKKEEVASSAIEILLANGAPMTRDELFDALQSKGMAIHGKNPAVVLQTMLWRMQERIVHLKGHGYWPANEDYPEADYNVEDEAEMSQEADEEEFDEAIKKLV